MFELGQLCTVISDLAVKTPASFFWTIIKYAIRPYWFIILPVLTLFVVWEIATRGQEAFGYKSKNGFSPVMNVLVGSLVYMLNVTLLGWMFGWFTGNFSACLVLMSSLHPIAFTATWVELRLLGFWVY